MIVGAKSLQVVGIMEESHVALVRDDVVDVQRSALAVLLPGSGAREGAVIRKTTLETRPAKRLAGPGWRGGALATP